MDLRACGFLVDTHHGAGRPGAPGRRREGCCGAEEERVPGRTAEAAGAARQDPVQPQLPDGKRQQAAPGREGKARCPQRPLLTDTYLAVFRVEV